MYFSLSINLFLFIYVKKWKCMRVAVSRLYLYMHILKYEPVINII